MKGNMKRGAAALVLGIMALGLAACGTKGAYTGNKLIFQIWDQGQKAGMEELVASYTREHPEVEIEVQALGWDEYWTKLEASAVSNTMPDIFWMHSNQMFKYADAGMLADCTDLIDAEKFDSGAVENAKGSDGKMYGVPKDKDIVALLYNKEIFDAAGAEYPNEDWTWDDLEETSEQIFQKTGKFGYMAYAHDQIGYWNFVYQNGGTILNKDGSAPTYTDPATEEAITYYIGLQENEWCPTQAQFANTGASELFFSGQGAMYYAGSWDLVNLCKTYEDMNGKWDVAVLPKCPAPKNGDGRASISNSVSYATSAKGKKKEAAMDFLAYLGSEEGQRLQGETGVAIPAFNGLEDTWVQTFADNGYDIHAENILPMFQYSVKYLTNPSRPAWEPKVEVGVLDIYAGNISVADGIENIQETVTEEIRKY